MKKAVVVVIAVLCVLSLCSCELFDRIEKNDGDQSPTQDAAPSQASDSQPEQSSNTEYYSTLQPGYSYYNDTATFDANASSTLSDIGDNTYSVWNAVDGNFSTAWVEGVEGDGIGESVSFTMEGTRVDALGFLNGYTKSAQTFANNGRVTSLAMYVNGEFYANIYLQNTDQWQYVDFSESIAVNGNCTITFRITGATPGPGDDEHDTAITEIVFYARQNASN